MTKNKHLTLSDRNTIQSGLEAKKNFSMIALELDKDPTTISKEIRKHLVHRDQDTLRQTLEGKQVVVSCPKLAKPPYACNGCEFRRRQCGYKKAIYDARKAQNDYEQLKVEAREGIPLNKQDFWEMEKMISQGVEKGQHIYHIVKSNELKLSLSTVYRHIDKGYLSISKIDLPRAVKFKKRKTRKEPAPIPKAVKEGRTYNDFLAFCQENDCFDYLQMDTVMGRSGGKPLLTFTETRSNFFFARLMADKTAGQTVKAITDIKNKLAKADHSFTELFPIVLTDNGGEFARADDIERGWEGERKGNLFYCDPMQSSQKAKVEKNHTMLRDILPKGTSFDELNQADIDLICSHINSVKRLGLRGKSSYEAFIYDYNEAIAGRLGIMRIPNDQVCQSTKLLVDILSKKTRNK